MSLGGGFCKEVTESCITSADSDVQTSDAELGSSTYGKAALGLGGNPGNPSNYDVHDQLECPVCMNLMYPPIYQVCAHRFRRFKRMFWGGVVRIAYKQNSFVVKLHSFMQNDLIVVYEHSLLRTIRSCDTK